MREAVLISKTDSRHGAEAFSEVSSTLGRRGISLVEAHEVDDRDQLLKRVKGAVKSGHRLILVAGGDGSQTTAVGAFAYKDAVLGVIPAGTGNSFALSLGIKPSIEDAVETIVNGRVAEVDLGIVNGTYFANFATIGILAQIGLDTPKLLKRLTGPIAYGISTIVPALKSKAFRADIQWDKNTLRLSTRQIIVANGRYFGVTPVLPDATITDGRLTFFATDDMSRTDVFKSGIAFLQGTQAALHNAHYFHTKRLKIRTKARQVIAIDGSWLGKTPAKFSVAPKALKVMVPLDFPASA